MSAVAALERAIAAFRAGRAVTIGGTAFLAVEVASPSYLERFDPRGESLLLITAERAAALSLGNQREASGTRPVAVERPDWLDADCARALADPGRDIDRGPIGPLRAQPVPPGADAALTLARRAGLLPALWAASATGVEMLSLDPDALDAPPVADIVARARLPIEGLPTSQIVAFRDPASGEDHVALVVGAFGGKAPLVRLHSECLTGDVFGSLKCDCGPQLKAALHLLAEEGGGVLLYLRQEGRGIGLANKLRAYALQDRGLDTVDANRRLGFADDERDYAMAAAMLRALGIDEVRLLTNNPAKVSGLEHEGIRVADRVAHHLPANPHNVAYLATKRARSGHLD